jgi:hypothetical protein
MQFETKEICIGQAAKLFVIKNQTTEVISVLYIINTN